MEKGVVLESAEGDIGVADIDREESHFPRNAGVGVLAPVPVAIPIHAAGGGSFTTAALSSGLLVPTDILLGLDGGDSVFVNQVLLIALFINHHDSEVIESGDLSMKIGAIGQMKSHRDAITPRLIEETVLDVDLRFGHHRSPPEGKNYIHAKIFQIHLMKNPAELLVDTNFTSIIALFPSILQLIFFSV